MSLWTPSKELLEVVEYNLNPRLDWPRHQHQLSKDPRPLGGLGPNSFVVHGTENIEKTYLLSSVHIVAIAARGDSVK